MITTIGHDIVAAKKWLEKGQTVAVPTETVYGLAGNALDEHALRLIYEVKQRPYYNPLIVHIADKDDLGNWVKELPLLAKELAEKFWPGPLTLVLPKNDRTSSIVSGGLSTIAIRVPQKEITLALLNSLDFPLAAPSANLFGYISPTRTAHVYSQLSGRIPYILEGGECERGIESTIVGFENGQAYLYREGALLAEEIELYTGPLTKKSESATKPLSPGMIPWHYSPRTPLLVCDDIYDEINKHRNHKLGLITLQTRVPDIHQDKQICLAPDGDLKAAAKAFYAALHTLDSLDLDLIIAQRLEEFGMGKTLNDRLKKASYRNH